ncbi:MAG: integral rane sensor signal transduction histidine kinase [Solirubrobacterales bacterium]|nr:integral rane sensor signal transduction histidine kinase [Solirubrobacterales bacterium]
MRGLRRALLHPSLRIKLTLAFAAAIGVLLTCLGLFIYARFEAGLDQSLNQGLHSRTNDVRALVNQADTGLADAGGVRLSSTGAGFAQVLSPGGQVLDQTPGIPRSPFLAAGEIAAAAKHPILTTTTISGVPGSVRVLATPVRAQDRSLLLVVGTSLQSRATTLQNLRDVMLLGGPVALVLASLLGYAVSALSLRSVEAMRTQAKRLSVAEPGRRLPVPPAHDEMRRLALTLNEMLDRNDVAFARERRFVADASHELRSPLAVLKTELEEALSGDASEDELRLALASADAETDRIANLARDLLTLAQADEGRLTIERGPLRLNEALERIGQRFAQRARSEGRMLVISVPDEMIIHADPLRLEQALSNLVDNSLRHGGGTVVLTAVRRDGFVEVRVADGGPGFPEAFLDIAFERFSRPDVGRTTEGTGLGLSIVSSIARAHGGEAHVANRPGGGAEAWITLPDTADVVPQDATPGRGVSLASS